MHVALWLENYIQAVLVGLASAAVPLKAALHMMLIHCVLFLPFGVGVISCADPESFVRGGPDFYEFKRE